MWRWHPWLQIEVLENKTSVARAVGRTLIRPSKSQSKAWKTRPEQVLVRCKAVGHCVNGPLIRTKEGVQFVAQQVELSTGFTA
uniref:Uncharacterized protein n=1 Tax=Hyaloperonospora arabidopsidis (strain Emoy2) TaxID=559515 RepID=M4BC53_HYAAE